MGRYILRRLLLIPLTLFGIMIINFAIVQFAPGGPVEELIAKLKAGPGSGGNLGGLGGGGDGIAAGSGGGAEFSVQSKYRGAQGLDAEVIQSLEKQFGFDQSAPRRFLLMMKNYLTFNFGQSYFQDRSVISLIIEKLPVSVSLGVWSTLLMYLISVPLGIAKAVRSGSKFDAWSSFAVIIAYAVPAFLLAVLLIVFFAGGTYLQWFPLRALTSPNWAELSWPMKIADYFWHLALPVASLTAGSFAALTMLTKNSFLEEIHKQYTVTARAKGLTERRILYGHVFRNAMLLVIAGIPSTLIGMLFTGSTLIEVVFSLDGLGLFGFESVMRRDYQVVFATLYIFTLIGLVLNLVSDVVYRIVDPRIDFEKRTS